MLPSVEASRAELEFWFQGPIPWSFLLPKGVVRVPLRYPYLRPKGSRYLMIKDWVPKSTIHIAFMGPNCLIMRYLDPLGAYTALS